MTAFSFHEGERAVQQRAEGGGMADRIAAQIDGEIEPPVAAFLADQPFLVLAARDLDGRAWATALAGHPGFARAVGHRTVQLRAPFAAGDPLDEALRNGPTSLGVLALEPATRRRVRLNGRAISDGWQTVLETDEVYGNCPKYISARAVTEISEPAAAGATASPPQRHDRLDDAQQRLIARADTVFLATSHPTHGADASHRGGDPGFVTVHDDRRLSFPDYAGNTMYMTLGNLTSDPHLGMLVPDFESGDLLLLSGTGTIDFSPERAATIPGAQRVVDMSVDAVVMLPAASPLRWGPAQRSPFTPSAPAAPSPFVHARDLPPRPHRDGVVTRA